MGLWMLAQSAAVAAASSVRTEHVLSGPIPGYTQSITVAWAVTLVNRTDQVRRQPELRCLLPVRVTSTQCCRSVRSSEPASLQTDAWGNQALTLRLRDLPPLGGIRVIFGAQIDAAPEPLRGSDAAPPARFLLPEPAIDSDSPEVIAAAARALSAAGSSGLPVDALSAWVARSLRHSGYCEADRGARWALANRRGDCSEFAALLTAMCRARGVAARRIFGVALPQTGGAISPNQLHVWAEAWDGDRWRPVDALRRLDAAHRPVAFAILTPGSLPVAELSSKWVRCDAEGVDVGL